jgi:hypothetical protein
MKRIELIANRSVENEIIEALENHVTDFYYTLLPQISGKGKTKYRLGTATWPEMNFLLISYLDDVEAIKATLAIKNIKERFPGEGIKLFIMEAELASMS